MATRPFVAWRKWALLSMVFLAVLLSRAGMAGATESPDGQGCRISGENWSLGERLIWAQLCSTGAADIAGGDIRAGFLVELFTEPRFSQILAKRPFILRRAVLRDKVDLSDVWFKNSINMLDCVFYKDLVLTRAKFERSLSLIGSNIYGAVKAQDVEIGGSFLLGEKEEGEPIVGAPRGGTHLGGIYAHESHIGGELEIVQATLTGPIEFVGSTIGKGLFFTRITAESVSLAASTILGEVALVDSEFTLDHNLPDQKQIDPDVLDLNFIIFESK